MHSPDSRTVDDPSISSQPIANTLGSDGQPSITRVKLRRRATDINRKRQLLGALLLASVTATVVFAARAIEPHASLSTAGASKLAHDTEVTTQVGTRFLAPAGWTLHSGGDVTWLSPPEANAWVAAVDARGSTADAALADAWSRLGRTPDAPLRLSTPGAARDGWTQIASYRYDTPAAQNRLLSASVFGRDGAWTVFFVDMPLDVADRRRSQLALINGRIMPTGHVRESFEGRIPRQLGEAEVRQLNAFIADARQQLGIPGVAMGLLQGGRVVYAGGQGLRAEGSPETVDEKTLFLVASNTKAMTTMMLARMVDAGRLQWDMPVVRAWPSFRLGSDDASRKIEVRHLLCACTGLPRQDYPWLMEFTGRDAEDVVADLRDVVPTTAFGQLYQYSNPLAAAGGYLGARIAHPDQPLGNGYDNAMHEEVFAPLGMRSTTFDFDQALAGNHASPHAWDAQGRVALVDLGVNRSIVPVRPAGGAWSNVEDMLRFVSVELARGRLPDGKRYVGADALLARWAPQVALGAEASYGMGLVIDRSGGVRSVQHGGSMPGYQTGMLWLPEHDVGIVLLTNADNGAALMGLMRRRLLEVLFDGRPMAAGELAAAAARLSTSAAAERRSLTVPAPAPVVDTLEGTYRNALLGPMELRREGGRTIVDFGEWRSEVGTRHNSDGTSTLVTVDPGTDGYELIVEDSPQGARLVLLESQHRYVFERADATKAMARQGEG
ncbi:serine hydrolase [Pseudoxanthomonas sp. SL93]|uniref:serine hydrolase domain-containing protein n=1 Tax=Pseudoxanthomonas sp. SL93 TaxID=2995142 RepID=UPI00226D6140|nr:serine hydrolase domain-containing protein [Pseudoxanthomonas sp. SL93]WAC64039.1 serine hydrolase [Pseudoxanthomonas sp. SL93]